MTTAMISIAGVVLVLCAAGAAAASTPGARKSFPVTARRLFAIRIIGYQEVKWDLLAQTPGSCGKYTNWEGKGSERLDFTIDEHDFQFEANLAMGRGEFVGLNPVEGTGYATVHLSWERRATQESTDCGETASWPTTDCGTEFRDDGSAYPVYYDTARKGLIHYGPKPGLAFNILYPLNEPYFVCPLGLNYLYESFPVLPFFDVPTHRTANITLLSLPLKRLLGLKVNGEMTVPENALTRGTQGEATIPGKLLCGSLIDFSSFQTGYSCYVEGRIYWLVFIRRVK